MEDRQSRLWVLMSVLIFVVFLFISRQLLLSYNDPTIAVGNKESETVIEPKEIPLTEACAALIPVIVGTDVESSSEYKNIQGATKSDALVTDIDYINKKITLDFITVELKHTENIAGFEAIIKNENKQLRTFSFDDSTLIYLEYLGTTSFYEKIYEDKRCYVSNNIFYDWGWYSLLKLPFDASQTSPDFMPYVEATVLNDKLLFLVRPTLSS
jgi:hypothetical protein